MPRVKAVMNRRSSTSFSVKVNVAEGSQGPVRCSIDVPADSDKVSVRANTEL